MTGSREVIVVDIVLYTVNSYKAKSRLERPPGPELWTTFADVDDDDDDCIIDCDIDLIAAPSDFLLLVPAPSPLTFDTLVFLVVVEEPAGHDESRSLDPLDDSLDPVVDMNDTELVRFFSVPPLIFGLLELPWNN